MLIDTIVLGGYQTNSYVLRRDEAARDCLVIDTGLDAQPLLEFLRKHRLTPEAVVLTHGHIDHIAGLDLMHAAFPKVQVSIHHLDAKALANGALNLSDLAGMSFTTSEPEHLLDDGDIVDYAGLALTVIHTPGHTPGGICLHSPGDAILFTGDTLFADSVGRTDFPLADMNQLLKSIKDRLFVLPDKTICYPGHGPCTTIGREKRYNQFLH